MTSLRMVALAALILLAGATTTSAQARSTAQERLAGLESDDPVTRKTSFLSMRRQTDAFARPGMAQILLRLLERENDLVVRTLVESNGTLGIADKYGEEYGEYVSMVLDECELHCDLGDPRTIRTLAAGYEADNPQAEAFAAKHGAVLMPTMLAQARDGLFDRRNEAVVWLGNIAAGSTALSEKQRATIDSAIIGSLRDTSDSDVAYYPIRALGRVLSGPVTVTAGRRAAIRQAVLATALRGCINARVEAVRVLGALGDATDVPVLRRMSKYDTCTYTNTAGRVSYPVRIAASKALGVAYDSSLSRWLRDSVVLDSITRLVKTDSLYKLYRRALEPAGVTVALMTAISCEEVRLGIRFGSVPADRAINALRDTMYRDRGIRDGFRYFVSRAPAEGVIEGGASRCGPYPPPAPKAIGATRLDTDLPRRPRVPHTR